MLSVLALSPHLDDAAFSAGATLARMARRGWRVVVATVFTGNVNEPRGFALACQLDKGLPADVDYMAIRRAEDLIACAALGAEAVHLPHLEAPHRGYHSPEALFGGIDAGDRAEGEVASSIGELIGRSSPDIVLLPRAVGGHVDHLVVRRAADAQSGVRHAYWTDWPYADRDAPLEPFAEADRERRVVEAPVRAADLDARHAACAAYQTQLGYQFGGPQALADRLARIRTERFLV